MTGWDDPTLIQGALCGWPGQRGKGLTIETGLSASLPHRWGEPTILSGIIAMGKMVEAGAS